MNPPLIVAPAGSRFVRGPLANAKVSALAGDEKATGETTPRTIDNTIALLIRSDIVSPSLFSYLRTVIGINKSWLRSP